MRTLWGVAVGVAGDCGEWDRVACRRSVRACLRGALTWMVVVVGGDGLSADGAGSDCGVVGRGCGCCGAGDHVPGWGGRLVVRAQGFGATRMRDAKVRSCRSGQLLVDESGCWTEGRESSEGLDCVEEWDGGGLALCVGCQKLRRDGWWWCSAGARGRHGVGVARVAGAAAGCAVITGERLEVFAGCAGRNVRVGVGVSGCPGRCEGEQRRSSQRCMTEEFG